MNERIKQLAEQARNYALDQKRHYESVHNTEQCLEEYREVYNIKFAELIVRECLDISHRESHLPNAVLFDERSDKFIKDIHNRVSRATREHFGVEE